MLIYKDSVIIQVVMDISQCAQAMILVNTAGQVTVPSVHSLENLLGSHPEPGSAITHSCDGQFLILEVRVLF